MRHQHGQRHRSEDLARDAAENELAHARMSVAPHHEEVRAGIRSIGEDDVLDTDIAARRMLGSGVDTMPAKMPDHIGAGDLFLLALFRYDYEVDSLSALQNRHRVCNRARSGAPAIPADDDAIELEPASLDIGHNQQRTSGVEERRLDQQIFRSAVLALRLADDRKIEPPRNAAEESRSAAKARLKDARLH